MSLQLRIDDIHKRIAEACKKSGRDPNQIRIVAVTKYISESKAEQLLEAGFGQIGENRWPDAKEKIDLLGERAQFHFIGHLQSKKVKHVVDKFSYFHSLDRLSVAEELNKRAAELSLKVTCFVQVNISGEESKYGVSPDNLSELIEKCNEFEHIDIIGLMTMAPYDADAESTRPVFRGLRESMEQLNRDRVYKHNLTELSMGMSNDFEIAIEEGATWIRLGSVLMGNDD